MKNPAVFHRFWGKVHPNYLNADFYKKVFENNPYFIASNPIVMNDIHPLQNQESIIGELSGDELMVIAKM